jgi:MYXO-CTERM domain-containing protein
MGRPGVWLKFAYLLALLGIGAAPRRAAANGAFPESDAVLLPVDHPQRIILSTNFGLIISDDEGATWQWTCERPETSMASTYAIGAPPQEFLYALSPEVGLASSDDVSCGWIRDGGALANTIATDFFPDPIDARRVLAIAPVPADAGIGADVVYESMDGGETFDATPIYVAPPGDQLVGVEIARSDPRIIYVAIAAPGPHPALARSDDAGATWSTFDLQPSIGARTARIIAVDPVDANVVYLRAIGAGAELLAISRDGGMTFTTPITLAGGSLSAFARLASGTVLVAGLLPGDGGTTAGVAWRSGDGGVTFDDWMLTPMPRLRALAERDGRLYLAGSNYSDGWALAVSTDEGRTIQPVARYDQVSAVRPCVAAICQDLCDEQAGRRLWAPEVCNPSSLDGGSADAGDGGGDAGPPPKTSSGCGCSSAAAPGADAGVAIALLFFATARRSSARRRRRGTRCSSAR